MPIVTEDFEIEKHAHVDALMANFQGVFLNQVKCVQVFFFKGHCHAIWQLYKKLEDAFTSFELHIAQNSATHPGHFLSLVALNLKSRESIDAKQ